MGWCFRYRDFFLKKRVQQSLEKAIVEKESSSKNNDKKSTHRGVCFFQKKKKKVVVWSASVSSPFFFAFITWANVGEKKYNLVVGLIAKSFIIIFIVISENDVIHLLLVVTKVNSFVDFSTFR